VRLPFKISSWTVAGRAALLLSLGIGLLFAVAGVFAYRDARGQALAAALSRLDRYNAEVVRQEDARFARIVAAHGQATELLKGELRTADAANYGRTLDLLYPRFGDGTRRSAPGLFDGQATSLGYLRGLGGFVGREPDAEGAARLIAATRAIHTIGEGARPDFQNISYFTPDNTLVMFAPGRADKLLFYRREAPASLDFRDREFLTITLPSTNPAGRTRCTSLLPILYDRTGRTWTTGCMTPIYLEGRYVGAWGTSLMLDQLLHTGHFSGLSSADMILVSREGRLILHPRYTRQNSARTERFLDLDRTEDPELRALWAFLRQHKSAEFLGFVPELSAYAALRRIETPGWYALTVQPRAVVEKDAWRALQRVAASALFCVAISSLLLFVLLRRQVGTPLRRLSLRAAALSDSFARIVDAPELIEDRTHDEVRQMELHFSAMADQIVAARDVLEDRVRERTEALERANDELRSLADRDPLTGLANRRKLSADFREFTAYGPCTSAACVLLFDVDHFKRINDRFGHQSGDQVLVAIAETATSLMRPTDTIARVGGEEFLILLPDTTPDAAWRVARRLHEALAACRIPVEREMIAFTVSIGIAAVGPEDTLRSVYRRADEALYRAKRSGRNRVERAACAASEVIAA
jgi:diguanylate cyclase (GGDEF)-like protein